MTALRAAVERLEAERESLTAKVEEAQLKLVEWELSDPCLVRQADVDNVREKMLAAQLDADALALVLRALSERAWQGMETFPKDDTRVLVLTLGGHHAFARRQFDQYHSDGYIVVEHGGKALAWQPLPDPPVDLAQAPAEERT